MTTNNNTENDDEEEEDAVLVIEEEFWPTATITGANNLLAGHRTHAIYFGCSSISSDNYNNDSNSNNDNGNDNDNNNNNETKRINNSNRGGRVLRYKSMSSEAMTPLDMTYGGHTNDNDNDNDNDADADVDDDDEFYDGTGNLMWMAAVCFGHLVAQQVEPLRSYLSYLPITTTTSTTTTTKPFYSRHNHHRRRYHRRVCELGCGTGGAGISLLLFSNNNNNDNIANNNSVSSSAESESGSGSCHVVFTDNDVESLELCKSNCELNEINPNNYSHRLLGWGLQQQQQQEEKVEVEQEQEKNDHHLDLDRYSFDTVLATDVVYDLKMIAPLLQTAEFLLKQRTITTTKIKSSGEECNNNNNNNECCLDDDDDDGGQLILSHIPRFCIPKNNEDDDDDRGDDGDRNVDSDIKLGEQPHDDIVATNTSTTGTTATTSSTTLYDNQAYLDLENFIQSEAIKVGLSLIETIRPHETLSNEYLFGNNNNFTSTSTNSNNRNDDDDDNDLDDDDNGDNDNDDDSMQQITLDNMKEAHAVVFIFNRTRTLC
jgi:hypothetical protein